MQRCCQSLLFRATLPLWRTGSRALLTPALRTSSSWTAPRSGMEIQRPSCLVSVSPSWLHSSAVFSTPEDDPPRSAPSNDKPSSSSPAEALGEEVLDESGFKLNWEEPLGDEEAGHEAEQKAIILEAALQHIMEHGWSEEALRAGARSMGVSWDDALFPGGGGELVEYFEKQCQKTLVTHLQDLSKETRGAGLLRAAVEYRLRMITPYQDSWAQAMAVKALPPNVAWSLQSLGVMVDEMWYWAGDRSTDINWYSKRATLASIYIATELFLIQDKSDDLVNTWKFLDQRFQDVKELGKVSGQVEGVLAGSMDLLKSAITSASQFACRARK